MEDIHSKLQEIRNPVHAIGALIREMDYETDADTDRGESSTAGQPCWESLGWRLSSWSRPSGSSPYPGDFYLSAHHLSMRLNLSQLYGSGTAVGVVCCGVYRVAAIRFLICRDLLILQQLLLRLRDPVSNSPGSYCCTL